METETHQGRAPESPKDVETAINFLATAIGLTLRFAVEPGRPTKESARDWLDTLEQQIDAGANERAREIQSGLVSRIRSIALS